MHVAFHSALRQNREVGRGIVIPAVLEQLIYPLICLADAGTGRHCGVLVSLLVACPEFNGEGKITFKTFN